jgi:hypothetical protein
LPAAVSGCEDCEGFPPALDDEEEVPWSAKAIGEIATTATLKTMVTANIVAKASLELNNLVID